MVLRISPADLLTAGLLTASVQRLYLAVLHHWIVTGQQRGLSGYRHRA